MSKELTYGYGNQYLTHQPRVVFDSVSPGAVQLYWDTNGNLSEITDCKVENARFHCWDVKRLSHTEELPTDGQRSKCGARARTNTSEHRTLVSNRLHAVIGPLQAGMYGYDGNGDRIWKLTGTCGNHFLNGGYMDNIITIDDAVFYPNPYLTITPEGYTKHYYLGSERIATAIGEGGWANAIDTMTTREVLTMKNYRDYFREPFPLGKALESQITNVDITNHQLNVLQYQCAPRYLEDVFIEYWPDIMEKNIYYFQVPSGDSEKMFFTHNNHLGSASWITDGYGLPTQYIHYAPYGELIDNQSASYDERYKFIGKERDRETGYDNFGARFLTSLFGIWISPDPLLDKYIYASPYMYCNGNPIKYVDSDGRYFDDVNEQIAQKIEVECQQKLSSQGIDRNRRNELNKTLQDIAAMRNDEKHEYRFELDKDSPGTTCNEEGGHQVITMYSNLEELDETTAHETRHGGQVARGEMFYDNNNQRQNYDIYKEIDAYRAQWGWRGKPLEIPIDDGHSYPVPANASYLDITKDFIKAITVGPLDLKKLYNF